MLCTEPNRCVHDYLVGKEPSCAHTVLSLPLPADILHAAARVQCGLQAVYACPAMAHWVSGIGVNRLP